MCFPRQANTLTHLTRVPAAVVVARAHEDVRDDLVAAGFEEHRLAGLVAHDWHRYLRMEERDQYLIIQLSVFGRPLNY